MKQILLSLLGLAMAFVLPSCIEFETEVTLNKDGSGTITEEMIFGAKAAQMIEMAGQQGDQKNNPLVEMKDEAKLKETAKGYGEGVTFVKAEDVTRPDGSKGVRVTYKFTDINTLKMNPTSGLTELGKMNPKVEGGGNPIEHATFKYADGKLTIKLPQPEKQAEGEEEKAPTPNPDDPQLAMMAQMMQGMKISAKLTIADGIQETNATFTDGNTITMIEMNIDEVLKNPDGMALLTSMGGKDPQAMAKAMLKLKGVKAETKKEVTVQLK